MKCFMDLHSSMARFKAILRIASAGSNSFTFQELICKGWFLPPNTYMTAAHLW